jgi:tetratricopeptide (TPR) repeat protein
LQLKTFNIDSSAKRGLVLAAALVFILFAYFAAKWGLANTASIRADLPEIAEMTAVMAPGDPQTHYSAAVLLEKSFNEDDLTKALVEYETAAALAPHNYLLWLDLGRARERAGDVKGAELAIRRAFELAPNYSRVQWALGNTLLRQGKTDEAFAEIRKAVAGDAAFTNSAATIAWHIFDGDMAQVRNAIGDSTRLNSALATLLAGQKRYDEAAAIWNSLPVSEKGGSLKETGKLLLQQFTEAKKFRLALSVDADINSEHTTSGEIGQISNGGFENDLKLQNAGVFEWQLGNGLQPQIAPTNGQKHSGNNSLVFIFNTTSSADFRPVSQTVTVESGKSYELNAFYKSDLKTSVIFKWEIVRASDGKVLAATEGTAARSDWTTMAAKFTVPDDVDGIIVRLARENCASSVCPVAGNLWFDDFRLAPVN